MTTRSEIKKLEDARYAAMIAGDAAALGRMLSGNLVYTHSSGRTEDKKEYLARFGSGDLVYHGVERPQESIRIYGDAAVIAGEVRIDVTVAGTRRQLRSRHLNVWAKEKGGWKMVAWESTPMA